MELSAPLLAIGLLLVAALIALFLKVRTLATAKEELTASCLALAEAAEEAQANEKHFQELTENTSDWVWEVNSEGVYTYVSPKIIDVLGYSSDEVLGKSPFDLMGTQEAERVGKIFSALVKNREPIIALENVNQHKNGTAVVLETNGVPLFDSKGELRGYRGIDRDITERKRRDEQISILSQAVEQNSNMIFITDIEGKISYINPKFTELTGYKLEEVVGQKPSIIKFGETPNSVYEDLWSTILKGEVWRGELKDRRKNGSVFWVSATIHPVSDGTENIVQFVAMHEDITERKIAEEKIHEAMRHAEIANRAKSELLANMSHELRTPLNAIIGFSNIIKDQFFGPLGNDKYGEYASDILNSGEHLLQLITDILDVSAIEAGKVELHEEDIIVETTVEQSVRLIQQRAQQNKISLQMDIPTNLPPLKADSRRVKQILLNLLSNAIKFTDQGGKVVVSASIASERGLTLSVKDTGVGMTKDELAKAMTQFGQADSGLGRKHEGSGLGLPLTKGLAELHNAHFEIDSEKGRGTQVSITFPTDRINVEQAPIDDPITQRAV